MHRFIAVIRSSVSATIEGFACSVARDEESWSCVHNSEQATVWVAQREPSRLGSYPLGLDGHSGVLIGRTLAKNSSLIGIAENSGKAAPNLWGAYVSLRIDQTSGDVTVYREPSGRVPCWYIRLDDAIIVFSHLRDLVEIFSPILSVNWEYISLHLCNRWSPGRQTGYREIQEVLPGEELRIRQGMTHTSSCWNPLEFQKDTFETAAIAKEELQTATEQAVAAWSGIYQNVLLDLSGGLDSSLLLGLMRRHAPSTDIIGVNYTIDHGESDERDFARIAAKFNSIELVERNLDASNLGSPADHTKRLVRPTQRTIPLGYDYVGEELTKRYGTQAFFTGTGGDHVFYDHITYDAAIDHYRSNGIIGLLSATHKLAQVSRATIWSGLGAVARWQLGADSIERELFPVNPFAPQASIDRSVDSEFIHPWIREARRVRVTPARFRQVCNLIEVQTHYWRFGRAESSEEVHPFLSQPIMEASLRTRPDWFCEGGIQRGLIRSAFHDVLPKEIRERRTKSSNSSHWLRVMEGLLPYLREILLEGVLARAGMLDRPALERILTPMGLLEGKNLSELAITFTVEHWLQETETSGLNHRSAA